MKYLRTSVPEWEAALSRLSSAFQIYAPVSTYEHLDYALIHESNANQIIYNTPVPTTPLKAFIMPFKQNVVNRKKDIQKKIVIGVPSCDLAALDLLDAMYLDEVYPDSVYRENRENTVIVASDCHSYKEHCHCVVYGINPYPESNSDAMVNVVNDKVFLNSTSAKGEDFIQKVREFCKFEEAGISELDSIKLKRLFVKEELKKRNQQLPDISRSNTIINQAEHWQWKKHGKFCVACGACAVVCPTCTCFLLIDKPDFEKVRMIDACQYPGFGRVAAGEDPLKELSVRFANRYLCKYVWKPGRFKTAACTGCGRCIETCIGKINKNKVLEDIAIQKG